MIDGIKEIGLYVYIIDFLITQKVKNTNWYLIEMDQY